MPLPIRTIKRIKDGAIKRMQSGSAAKLVSKGGYTYVDGGVDESNEAAMAQAQRKSYKKLSNTDSDIIKTTDIKIVATELAPEQVRKLRGPRRIVKKVQDVPPEVMRQIRAANQANPPPTITPGKGVDALKSLIDQTKAKRKRTRARAG
jgi:hypothetical protein